MRRFNSARDRKERRRTIEQIRISRISQLESKAYREVMQKMESHERLIRHYEARLEGRKVTNVERTDRIGRLIHQEEKRRLRQQQHTVVSEMSPQERAAFEREQDEMWSSIPAHMREKAKRYLEH